MIKVTELPGPETGRIESGPIQFGDDWPGVFLRGDEALYMSFMLMRMLEREDIKLDPLMERPVLAGLAKTLASCDMRAIRASRLEEAQAEQQTGG